LIVHTPVLPDETIDALSGAFTDLGDDCLMVDGTLGEGGHSERFLTKFPALKIVGIDADSGIMQIAMQRLRIFGDRITYHSGWADDFFSSYPENLEKPGIILIDLGVSLFHYEKGARGFSFQKDEALDMRIDTSKGESASALLSRLSEREIADLLFFNAEERGSRRIARAIVEARPVFSSLALASIVERAVPRRGRIHPATKTFQALRIAVNRELERLPCLLETALSVLRVGGRLGVISFHSLEDRIVKNFFREKSMDCVCPPSTPICICRGHRVVRLITRSSPTEAEIAANPPSRSAKLRVVQKVCEEG
jgi:16S rRNA (cytosine1402-N4)-methyltransferase